MCNGDIGLSLSEVRSLTYQQMWDVYVEPNLEESKKPQPVASRDDGWSGDRAGKKTTGFDPTRATEAEMDSFLTQFCGSRVYDGPKWWIPGTVSGIETYNGPGK